jgi:hypothetical protein
MGRDAVQEGSRREHVAVRLNLDLAIPKAFCEHSERRRNSESPGIGIRVRFIATDLTDSWKRRQEYSAGLQYPVERIKGGSGVVNQLQGLSKNNAVKGSRRNIWCVCQVSDDRGSRMPRSNVEHVLLRDAEPSKPAGISIVADF